MLDNLGSDDEKSDDNINIKMKAKLIPSQQEKEESDQKNKIRTTPQSIEEIKMISEEKNIFNSLVQKSNKKRTVFSVKRDEDFDENPYDIQVPVAKILEKQTPEEEDKEDQELSSKREIEKEYEEKDEVELEDHIENQETEEIQIPDIFKNTKIIERNSEDSKPRYYESDCEGEDEDFYGDYNDDSPIEHPGSLVN